MNKRPEAALPDQAPLAIVCGGGSLPFAVADAVTKSGRPVVLFPLEGWADRDRVAGYPHHWTKIGKFGWFFSTLRAGKCRDVVFIGTLARPSLRLVGFDFGGLKILPEILRSYRGGDDHLLSGVAGIFERRGFRLVAAHEVAPEILVSEGSFGRRQPTERETDDIHYGLALLNATGKFDVGQAVVVADRHVLAVEAVEGTDAMLARVTELRKERGGAGSGVLVKAPKPDQDRRFDLPSIGPQTVAGAARAGLAGIAVVAGASIVAEPQRVTAEADRQNIFVVGITAGGSGG